MSKTKSNANSSKSASETKSAAGRPSGAKSRRYLLADAPKSRCAVCQSTDRTNYDENRTILRGAGVDPVQGPFNVVVLRPTRCKQCGQWRRDRTLLNTSEDVSDEEIDELLRE